MAADATDAVEFLRLAVDADSMNRSDAMEDLRFRFGDQWPLQIQNSRMLESRPALTINEVDAYLRKIENQQRQQRPRMNPHPVGSRASIEVAKVLKGLCRHVEVNSDADNAYDLAFAFALTMGWGFFRMRTDYVREDSRSQDIYIDQIENPFSVYFDQNSTLPDGSDAEKALITDMIPRSTFRMQYPDAQEISFTTNASGDGASEWVQKDNIRVAEYFCIDRVKAKLLYLSNGKDMFEDDKRLEALASQGITIIGSRDSFKRKVTWQKQTQTEVLETRVLPGRWIPVIPVYGVRMFIDNKRRTFGLVRFAKDPQTMLNFWQTAMTEIAAMAPKAKWLLAEGQDEGHENEFARANVSALPYLRYKPTTLEGQPVPPPQRVQPEVIPAAALQNAAMMSDNLKRVLGVYDPQTKTDGNKSGKAIRAETMQSEISNFNYYDNLTRSLKHAGRIVLDWTPVVYDTAGRVARLIGDDGKPKLVTLNERKDEDGIEKILNDVTVAEYDVVMDVGPGYNTKRQEALEVFTELLRGPLGEVVAKVGADLIVRMLDADGADTLADRLAASNPLSEIDENSDIPPKVQMIVKGLQGQVQQLTQQLQAAGQEIHSRQSVAEIKEAGATIRKRMETEGEKEERRITQAQKQHDTETYALTAQNVAEINGIVRILTSKSEHGNRMREMLAQFEHEVSQLDREQAAQAASEEITTTETIQ